jgi:hypothetical protein
MTNAQQLRTAIGQLHIGDTMRVVVARDSAEFTATVVVSGYDRPVVHVDETPNATAGQRAERARWLAGQ